jgi:hypothetical protein
MEANSAKSRTKRGLAAAALAATGAAVIFAWLQPSHGQVPAALSDPAFCTVAPDEARATPADPADVQFNATVPFTNPTDWVVASSVAAAKGDVVRVSVTSPRDGGIAVHGLMDLRPMHARDRITVEFRAIYSGRFPIHFHGADGSHFEIAAIEVLPTLMSSAQVSPKP